MKTKTIIATGLSAALLLPTGTALADPGATSPRDGSSATTTAAQTAREERRAVQHSTARRTTPRQRRLIAEELEGATTAAQLKDAQKTVRAAIAATDALETPEQIDALMATELGVDVDDLQAAFDAVVPERGDRRRGRRGGGDGERRGDRGEQRGDCDRQGDAPAGSEVPAGDAPDATSAT